MHKIVNSKSKKTTVPELDLFSIPDTSVGVVNSRYVECPMTNSFSSGSGPIEWRYNLQKSYLNLQRSYVQFTIGLRGKDGKKIKVGESEKLPIAFCQLIGKT